MKIYSVENLKLLYSKRVCLAISFFLISLLRLHLTSNRNIIAINSPHDEFWYVERAFGGFFGGAYNQMASIHLPIYSWWLYLLHCFHIPARSGIEFAWILSIGYLAFSIFRLTKNIYYSVLVFAFLSYHPYTFVYFERTLSETLLAVLSTIILGAAIELWSTRAFKYSKLHKLALVIYVFGYGLAFHVREEGIALAVPLIILFSFSCIKSNLFWSKENRGLVISLLVAPIVAIFIIGILLASVNYHAYGVFNRDDLSASGYKRAIAALNKIDAGETPRHFTVTRKVLESGYSQSPTLRELKSSMESGSGKMWQGISEQNTGILGEIGNGWFFWALRDVAAQVGWYRDAKTAELKYNAVADEIENAFENGYLRSRGLSYIAFLDPDLTKWIPSLLTSLKNISELVFLPRYSYLEFVSDNATPQQIKIYTLIAGYSKRRPPNKNVSGVKGWVRVPEGTLIGFGDDRGYIFSKKILFGKNRPDVVGAYPFDLSVEKDKLPAYIWIKKGNGAISKVNIAALQEQTVFNSEGDFVSEVGIDAITYSGYENINSWLLKFCLIYYGIGLIFLVIMIASLIIVTYQIMVKNINFQEVIFLLIFSVIAGRIILFSIIDASAFNATQARYMLPILPDLVCMNVFGLGIIFKFIKEKIE